MNIEVESEADPLYDEHMGALPFKRSRFIVRPPHSRAPRK